jgi:hypothetical protein
MDSKDKETISGYYTILNNQLKVVLKNVDLFVTGREKLWTA